VTNHEVHSFL